MIGVTTFWSNPIATMFKSNERRDSLSPYIVSFSSRGPNPIIPDILKPDIAAPGAEIIATWPPISPVSNVKGDKRVSNFKIRSGISMARPHVAAAAAYVKSFHSTWSPGAIKSALMTTATPMSSMLNLEAEFACGAGQINPIKAVSPSLVYDISESDYVRFLCGQGYKTKFLRYIMDGHINCKKTKNETVWDLNLPSFTLKRNFSVSFGNLFRRTVLSFSSVGEKRSFTITIEGRISVGIVSASLIWDDGNFQVRSPVVVYST